MKEKVLLIGNGINDIAVNKKNDWENLIDGLINFIGEKDRINKDDKPFPLLYEEIYTVGNDNKKSETEIKKFIAEEVKKFKPNEIHQRISDLNIRDILTTNYDFTLEQSISNLMALENKGLIKETKYSIFRHYNVGHKKVWHIHGDYKLPNTINLGYEQYGGYLQRMREYLVTGTNYKTKIPTLKPRIKHKRKEIYNSWIDHFFLKNVSIVGLTFNFAEYHLWWLITYRNRMKISDGIPYQNKITYYYPSDLRKSMSSRLELFRKSGVEIKEIERDRNNKVEYYLKVLESIESE